MRLREDAVDLSELELQGLVPRSRWTRRGFVATSLVTGFALSVQPISAETITTDSAGLVAGEVKVKTADVEIPAYRAMPDKGGPFPTVLVVQEVFGVHEHIKDLCRRFAKAGYFAIAPELYVRQGDPSKYTEIPKLVSEIVSKVPDAQVISDLDAAVAYAKGIGQGRYRQARRHRVLLGRADHLALRRPQPRPQGGRRLVRVDRPAAHGIAAEIPDRHRRRAEGAGARPLRCCRPGYPGRDRREDGCGVQGGRKNLRDQDLSGYPARLQRRLPSYRPEAAKDGWAKMLTWFKEHGVA